MDFVTLEAAVRRLISGGKYKTALDQAKDLHKAHGTPASESLLWTPMPAASNHSLKGASVWKQRR